MGKSGFLPEYLGRDVTALEAMPRLGPVPVSGRLPPLCEAAPRPLVVAGPERPKLAGDAVSSIAPSADINVDSCAFPALTPLLRGIATQ